MMTSSKRQTKPTWSTLGSVLSGTVNQINSNKEDQLEWFNLQWRLAVGEQLASISRIIQVTKKTLYLQVSNKDWIPAIKSLERRILSQIKNQGDPFTRIRFMEGLITKSPPNKPIAKSNQTDSTTRSHINPQELEGSLSMIKEESLKEILHRLGQKIRFISVLLLSVVFISNCSTLQANESVEQESSPRLQVASSSSVDLSHSLAIEKSRNQTMSEPEGDFKDPRAYYHYLMALKSLRKSDFKDAAFQYEQLVEYDAETEEFSVRLAQLLLRTNQMDKAIEFCREALIRYPKNNDIREIYADILSSRGQKEKALEQYEKTLELDSKNTRSILLAGIIYEDMGRYDKSTPMFQKVVLLEPSNPLGYYYLGKSFVREDRFDKAKINMEKVLALRPNFNSARTYLGWIFENLGHLRLARQEYQIVLKLNPQNLKVKEYLSRLGDPKPAMAFEEETFKPEINPPIENDPSIHLKIGKIYFEQAAYLKALDEFRLVSSPEERNDLRVLIAKIYEVIGRLDEAIEEMNLYMAEERESMGALLQTARLYSMNKQTEKAIELLIQAAHFDPTNSRLFHSLALAHSSVGKHEKGVQYMEAAIKLDPNNASYYFDLGALMEKTGNLEGAIENMKKTIILNPLHSNAHNFLGYIYAIQGTQLNEAEEHLKKALKVQPRNGYFLDSLGWIYFQMGEHDKALEQIKKAIIYTPPDPVLYDHLGDIHFELRNYVEAHKAWRSSRTLTRIKQDKKNLELPNEADLDQKIKKVQQLLRQNSF